ncbi:thiamine pyrophosphate-dependent dehydrogenase E1 component subunit alpha [Microbacterium sp. APC 3898]|uniref:Thiamine pyrophosphate-dependent dehydrogenase E1 component subunit alpha n=1 Tax=Planococcus notacanthi TaxID=3035188 RepID=A0ABT7ZJK5_9BACL|nr:MULTISPECIES: thiamine pyrophosphate-dependent dehydrogenase E1 component subunit alpha [Terrabacteria group]MBF6632572.1 thiamine pyrophosphate-dependent dehydrogenase E1 component subunit alpha [Planococcus sp. (in: firmicutes)]MDN3427340.1 thiamine pyrophosphate-dependent dehydrogenase E1 component subunit alpha [Planococcus sp. APC 4016]MDN3436689.1 thiamine pyrophosphate-dependent dehydrogenase E1 component subunit alpha [Planococcus sp. APC 3900]MDN3499622.1 thiamine pyrophosphate-depe
MTQKLKLPPQVKTEELTGLYKQMWLIRFFEEKVDEFFAKGMIHGTTHLSVGQEASAVGSIAVLEDQDKITSTHRGHGHCIAKGATVNGMMAELFGRTTGYCKGKGGSMHIADVDKGNLGANGIVGGGFAIAAGAALTSQMKKAGYVVLCFFGDGASNEGSFHEAINLASIWKLPVVFICENNQYGMSGPVREMINIEDIAARAASYGIPGKVVDGNDVFDVMNGVGEAVERARNGEGPSIIEAKTYRSKGHSKSDAKKYRTREEEKEWLLRDPIKLMAEVLIEEGIFTQQEADGIKAEAKKEIEESVEFAKNSPEPELDALLEDIYA